MLYYDINQVKTKKIIMNNNNNNNNNNRSCKRTEKTVESKVKTRVVPIVVGALGTIPK